jgi:molybdopterin/thiamine biosynthesis adenylyltransferase
MWAKIDRDLHSRQLYAIGDDAQKSLSSASVLISGFGGLGVEIAKNLILVGIGSVTLQDDRVTALSDLAPNFYLSADSIGQNRASASLPQLRSLNSGVIVSATTEPLSESYSSNSTASSSAKLARNLKSGNSRILPQQAKHTQPRNQIHRR